MDECMYDARLYAWMDPRIVLHQVMSMHPIRGGRNNTLTEKKKERKEKKERKTHHSVRGTCMHTGTDRTQSAEPENSVKIQ
jgi:hypothetical protein